MNYQDIENTFKDNVNDIFKLMEFDQIILDVAITGLEDLQETLRKSYSIDNPRQLAENALQLLRSIREHKSLRPRYQVIFNQCVVLLVSIFASSVSDLFKKGINDLAEIGDSSVLKSEELKISVSQLLEFNGEIKDSLGDLIAEKNDLSFQDMKSIGRAFKTYFGFTIEKDVNVNNIIMAQAGRHVIVHDSSRINDRILRQVFGAHPRTLKPELSGNVVSFDSDEVTLIANSMQDYLKSVRKQIENRVAS
jgi:hypothetical protein